MSKKKGFIYGGLIAFLCIAWLVTNSSDKNEVFSERAKIALREVGNQLLLLQQDSTSLVLPVNARGNSTYKIAFEKQLSFEPSQLVTTVEHVFKKSKFPEDYLVEVFQCTDEEVSYSYEINKSEESTIIPCAGRYLPEQCYTIDVKFTGRTSSIFNKQFFLYLLLTSIAIFLLDFFNTRRLGTKSSIDANESAYNTIGSFQFYPDQNKLIKAAVEIELSKKECELLAIFASRPNEIIKRDELTKKVWEDNGVFVGRSLDTYISKLRKKLVGDDTVKLTNIHGVGYKLEINR